MSGQPLITNDQLAGPLFHINNIVTVEKDAGIDSFSSIAAAMASITTATALNPIAIMVGPGVYTEPSILMKPYVKLIGWAGYSHTIIQAATTTQTCVVGINNSEISDFSITGATGAGGKGMYFNSISDVVADSFRVNSIRFLSNTINCMILSSTHDTYFVSNDLFFVTYSNATTNHLILESTGTAALNSVVTNSKVANVTGSGLISAILCTGTQVHATFNGLTLQAIGANSVGDGIVAQDGASVDVVAGAINGYNHNIRTINYGAAPTINIVVNLSEQSTTRDLSIEHPGTLGLFSGAADISKVFIDDASTLSTVYNNT